MINIIRESFIGINFKDGESLFIEIKISMKETLRIIKSMERELILFIIQGK